MRLVLQRALEARVEVSGAVAGSIGPGLLVLLGIEQTDTERDADYLVHKTVNLRLFPDESGKMNRSLLDSGGGLLIVSQFTLYGDCRKGMRPSFDRAAPLPLAKRLYDYYVERARQTGVFVQSGVFQASMSVYLINDGPVTVICDSTRERE